MTHSVHQHLLSDWSGRAIWRHAGVFSAVGPGPGGTCGVSRCIIHHMLQNSGTDSLHPSAKVPRHVSSWRTTEANSRRFSQMSEWSNVNEQMGRARQSDRDESLKKRDWSGWRKCLQLPESLQNYWRSRWKSKTGEKKKEELTRLWKTPLLGRLILHWRRARNRLLLWK